MSTLLSNSEIVFFKDAFSKHFDTFTYNRTRLLTVWKEPLKTVTIGANSQIYGYGSDSSSNVVYTSVSGIFPAMITYKAEQKITELEDIKNVVHEGEVRIKLERNAINFIEDGRKNERFEFDEKSYNSITSDGVQSYLGLNYYIYILQNTI